LTGRCRGDWPESNPRGGAVKGRQRDDSSLRKEHRRTRRRRLLTRPSTNADDTRPGSSPRPLGSLLDVSRRPVHWASTTGAS
jgi:hypothetical protein